MINWSLMEELSITSSVKELMCKLSAYSKDIGFDNFGLAVQFSDSYFERNRFFCHDNYQNGWKNSFTRLADHSVAAHDLRVLVSKHKMPAVVWKTNGETSCAYPISQTATELKTQLESAATYGINSGVTLPLFLQHMAWGFVTFTCNSDHSIFELEPKLLNSVHYIREPLNNHRH